MPESDVLGEYIRTGTKKDHIVRVIQIGPGAVNHVTLCGGMRRWCSYMGGPDDGDRAKRWAEWIERQRRPPLALDRVGAYGERCERCVERFERDQARG
jgi:hypothetical protein